MKITFIAAAALLARTTLSAQTAPSPEIVGETIFNSTCSACHNLDGRGGGHAPNISAGSPAQSYTDDRIAAIVHNGIPSLGMPAFGSLSADQLTSLVRHLRKLQETGSTAANPSSAGDIKSGRTLFFGKASCSQCHAAEKSGGFIASDLTGTRLKGDSIRQAILHPPSTPADTLVRAVLTNHTDVLGLIRNEDNFSLQLQAPDGTFHMLSKSEIQRVERRSETFMPSSYGRSLSAAELQDIVAFVASLAAK